MKTPKALLLDCQPFSKGPANIALSSRDLAGLKALLSVGGMVRTPAELMMALAGGVEESRQALSGGRLIRRLESFGFVRPLNNHNGFEITVTGRAAASQL